MLEFIITNYLIFIIVAVVLLLGLFGYMMDKKKYTKYREEIMNEQKTMDILQSSNNIETIAEPISLNNQETNNNQDSLTESN